ncbi:MAG: hypothetical protein KKA65_04545 [Nanoarchaeota archaeon]|nr:hypothetical protein [Nanoarchaeota archaeon]MBU4351795.1 hypothetical protein [Nanoarchaeota archaeon]MBU4456745.1 hypothetical protein [Nanoarchaeota archaeon]MCG2719666.1 hypothetical protein [Nanoarchaeota archaeon]
MALPLCLEAFIRTFLVMIKLAMNNWFLVLILIGITYALKKSSWGQGALGTVIDLMNDFVMGFSLLTAGFFSFFGRLFIGAGLAIALGIVWMMMALTSPANMLLKIFSMPVFFVIGVIAAVLPFFSLPMSLVLSFLFKDQKTANFTCIIAIVLIVLSSLLGIDFVCNGFNWIALQLQ